MKCQFCNEETQMTVRDGSRNLHNCCIDCKNKKNRENLEAGKDIKFTVSCIWKDKETTNEDLL